MGIYNTKKEYFDTLQWDDVFTSAEEFAAKMSITLNSNNSALEPIGDLYEILAMRYAATNTRYTSEMPFILALKRELIISWPIYRQQKAMMDELMTSTIDELKRKQFSIANSINNPTVELPENPSQEVIPNLSTTQNTLLHLADTMTVIAQKYDLISRHYLDQMYRRLDSLFRMIQRDETYVVYPQGGE